MTRLAIYIGILVALLLVPMRAEQPTLITLSCSGTQRLMIDDAPTPVVDIGFVVDLNGRSVAFASHHVPISGFDSTRVDDAVATRSALCAVPNRTRASSAGGGEDAPWRI
jgi:hypothetical protein